MFVLLNSTVMLGGAVSPYYEGLANGIGFYTSLPLRTALSTPTHSYTIEIRGGRSISFPILSDYSMPLVSVR